jgi:hypothetical protein
MSPRLGLSDLIVDKSSQLAVQAFYSELANRRQAEPTESEYDGAGEAHAEEADLESERVQH